MVRMLKTTFLITALIAVAACNSSPSTPAGPQLTVDPTSISTQSGQSAQFSVMGENGAPITTGVNWSSSNPGVAMISPSGMMTTGFASGRAIITARAGSATGEGEVNVVRACGNPVAIAGDAGPGGSTARDFDVRFDPSEDASRLTNEFAAQYGFQVIETYADGFLAELTTAQINPIVCRPEVETITYG